MIYLIVIVFFIVVKAVPLVAFQAGGTGPAIGWGIVSIIITFIPGINHLGTEGGYMWIDERNTLNPLYVKGFFRRNVSEVSGHSLWAGLKSDFWCQIVCIIQILCLTLYSLCVTAFGVDFNLYAENISSFFFLGIAAFKFVTHSYYMWVYTQAFRYTENEEGIWQPFSKL
ncbi:hypothetical protein NXH76_21960 [Blautia schinkii]|nr:hypothetical protein [Blautia schinkii]